MGLTWFYHGASCSAAESSFELDRTTCMAVRGVVSRLDVAEPPWAPPNTGLCRFDPGACSPWSGVLLPVLKCEEAARRLLVSCGGLSTVLEAC